MKHVTIWFCFLLAAHPAGAGWVDPSSPTNTGPKNSVLVFSDEFNGSGLDTSKWRIGEYRVNAAEDSLDDSVFIGENCFVRNGALVLRTRREPRETAATGSSSPDSTVYSGGAVNTKGVFALEQDMYVEMRIKFPLNQGGYCMCRLQPNDCTVTGCDPSQLVQINVFEFMAYERKRRYWSTLLYKDYSDAELRDGMVEGRDYLKLHDGHNRIIEQNRQGAWRGSSFNMPMFEWYEWFEWNNFVDVGFMATPQQFKWFISQNEPAYKSAAYLTFNGAMVKSRAANWDINEFAKNDVWRRDVPRSLNNYLVISSALRNAQWAGGPINDRQLPSEMLIDYVRIFRISPEPVEKR